MEGDLNSIEAARAPFYQDATNMGQPGLNLNSLEFMELQKRKRIDRPDRILATAFGTLK